MDIPELGISPYKENFSLLTFIFAISLAVTRVFKRRFKSFWDIFLRVSSGLFLGTLFSIALIYAFRIRWSSFPSSIFVIFFPLGILLMFFVNSSILRVTGRVKKRVVVIGTKRKPPTVGSNVYLEKIYIDSIGDLVKYSDVDEIIIHEGIRDGKNFNLLICLLQRLRTDIFFAPDTYSKLLSESLNDNGTAYFLATFLGKKTDMEEFLIRTSDIVFSSLLSVIALPLMLLIAALIKVSSPGSVFYKQQRVGKDGKIFTLYKFRTMIKDAEKLSSLKPASMNDSRVTAIGRWLRIMRLDELPQLLNILKGQMSLVGPRPENVYRVNTHSALRGIRLAVKPGLTGLAQIKSFYDLHPKHKVKYDYLYIQRRSLRLNLYIIAKTIPAVFSKKGW
jgi:lipopolysaccharide/colanic/teichoic acid biosynthesis glycosyltransferase